MSRVHSHTDHLQPLCQHVRSTWRAQVGVTRAAECTACCSRTMSDPGFAAGSSVRWIACWVLHLSRSSIALYDLRTTLRSRKLSPCLVVTTGLVSATSDVLLSQGYQPLASWSLEKHMQIHGVSEDEEETNMCVSVSKRMAFVKVSCRKVFVRLHSIGNR